MSEKRKIAFFIPALGFGGAEKVVSLLQEELTNYYDVTLILFYNEIHLPLKRNTKVIVLSKKGETFKTSLVRKIIDYTVFLFKYIKVLKSEKIEVSISFLARQNIMNGIAKMSNKKLKTIISERCFPSIMYKSFSPISAITKFLIPIFYNKNDLLFSNSVYINKDLIENYKLKISSSVIYNPIITKSKKPKSATYEDQNEIFKIVSVGRLIPVKNHANLIKSMPLLSDNFELDLYGDGELEIPLKQLSKELNVDKRIDFKGNVRQIKTIIVENHCFVLSSLTEGFPNVILEAMSIGLPVISTNCMSGPLELLNDNEPVHIENGSFYKAKFGLLINVNDEIGMAEAIKFFQSNPEIREQYSDLSFERSQLYDIAIIGNQVKELIDSL
jgi:N-acetylgalactosamine-N,N'-diacetylbacillosaminyl-diphospho-undecaprenol 4-alpha-N-acetylgalactosaminyltransferase